MLVRRCLVPPANLRWPSGPRTIHAGLNNQVEVWFSTPSAKALRGASFRSVKDVIAQIDAFIAACNREAARFEWTKVNFRAKSLEPKCSN
jgi:hypothetical protein